MKVFLSHSSKDKGFVEAAANLLKPGTYELDSLTFEKGILNAQAIIDALRHSQLFCLFLSKSSLESDFVNFEVLMSAEFVASGKISQVFVICLDDESFESASSVLKYWNIVRRVSEASEAARLIQGRLVTAAERAGVGVHPFMGREQEISDLESQVTDYRRPNAKAIFVSGNFGTGRRTIAQRFYERQYRHVGRLFPTIQFDAFAGLW